jgi:hypothetical protein
VMFWARTNIGAQTTNVAVRQALVMCDILLNP